MCAESRSAGSLHLPEEGGCALPSCSGFDVKLSPHLGFRKFCPCICSGVWCSPFSWPLVRLLGECSAGRSDDPRSKDLRLFLLGETQWHQEKLLLEFW